MKPSFINHSFTTIGYRNSTSKVFIEGKLTELVLIYDKLEKAGGRELAESVTGHGELRHCLHRCLQYYDKTWAVTEEDYLVFYAHAHRLGQEMERMVDEDGENSLFG